MYNIINVTRWNILINYLGKYVWTIHLPINESISFEIYVYNIHSEVANFDYLVHKQNASINLTVSFLKSSDFGKCFKISISACLICCRKPLKTISIITWKKIMHIK